MEYKQFYDFVVKVHSIAKIGLTYSQDPYAIENYNELNELSKNMLETFMDVKFDRPNMFTKDVYPTPNISCRTLILNDKEEILLVKEVNSNLWSLPGGWCDLYDNPSETAKNECRQEAGVIIKDLRLVGVTNCNPLKADVSIPNYVVIFEAKIDKFLDEHEYETDDVNFFDIDNLPEISRKTTKEELLRFITAAQKGEIIFD